MQGYSTIVSEIWSQISKEMKDNGQDCTRYSEGSFFSHVFLQAGVGSFAGGIAAALISGMKAGCPLLSTVPKIVVVEPRGAHCFFHSHNLGDGNLHGNDKKIRY